MRCVSLFSGCGGLDLGLQRAGFEIILACDNDPRCEASHRANFPETPFFGGRVVELLPSLESGELLSSVVDVDLLAGGPPCPPYSKSRFYRKEKPRALDDGLASETLSGFLDTLRLFEPRAFLLENVAGLAYKVHREALAFVVDGAKSAGYECSWKVLNAADYGVPQLRERFFLVGMREGTFSFPEPTHSRNATDGTERACRTAGDVLADLDTLENADDAGHFAGGQFHELLREIPPGDNYLYFTAKRGHAKPRFEWRSRYWSFLLKLDPARPSWTIQARRSNNMGPFHWRNRILRIDEIKRLQTFPDDWTLVGTVEQQWRQVGNAVPPLLAEVLGQAIRAQLEAQARDRLIDAA
jgi:DNA (cytosine-5)-methyltransferase 1